MAGTNVGASVNIQARKARDREREEKRRGEAREKEEEGERRERGREREMSNNLGYAPNDLKTSDLPLCPTSQRSTALPMRPL
jgi:hypothetical protein